MNFLRRASGLLSRLPHRRPYHHYYHHHPSPELHHFRRRSPPKWYHSPRNLLIITVVSGAGAASLYYGYLEPVPYTKRSHFILVSPPLERRLGESQFEQLKAALQSKILPPTHPDSVRVRLICHQIINALQRGLVRDHSSLQWTDMAYGSAGPSRGEFERPELVRETILLLDCEKSENRWSRDEEVLDDDNWISESRRKGEEKRVFAPTKHLEGLKWEVVVVRDDMVNAMCLPGGKIVVFSGLLDHFRSDAEIATVIGHEV